ncbi:hypothetical protein AAHA92_16872 [Salvia divinorum]|uniref:Uncharacterized protein n=1 Tax=Salvia divinorum TaxID=28513 RepID=A0ABD1GWZ0_SALDI
MVLPLPHQSSFIYTANWTPTLDSTLVQMLMRLKKKHGWDATIFPRYLFVETQGTIWNCDNNLMVVVDHHLSPLMKMNQLAVAYYRHTMG